MSGNRRKISVVCGCGLAVSSVLLAAERPPPLLVVPARQTVVQFSFDVARLRSVYLVAYDLKPRTSETVLHVWNGRSQEWAPVQMQDVASGSVFGVLPDLAILVGRDEDVPAELASAVAACCADVRRIPKLSPMDLANGMNESMEFTAHEWRWLKDRYGLTLKDLNEERRRYGRYGKPGEPRKTPVPSAEPDVGVDMPPVPMVREPTPLPLPELLPSPAAPVED